MALTGICGEQSGHPVVPPARMRKGREAEHTGSRDFDLWSSSLPPAQGSCCRLWQRTPFLLVSTVLYIYCYGFPATLLLLTRKKVDDPSRVGCFVSHLISCESWERGATVHCQANQAPVVCVHVRGLWWTGSLSSLFLSPGDCWDVPCSHTNALFEFYRR